MKVYISVTYYDFLKMGCKLMLKSDVYFTKFLSYQLLLIRNILITALLVMLSYTPQCKYKKQKKNQLTLQNAVCSHVTTLATSRYDVVK